MVRGLCAAAVPMGAPPFRFRRGLRGCRAPPDETWAAIRAAYEESDQSVRGIGRAFNVDPTAIRDHAVRYGWRLRPKTAGCRPAVKTAAASADGIAGGGADKDAGPARAGPARLEPDTPEVRVLRLLRVIDMQIDNMERLMSSGEALSPQDQERNARAMAATLSNLEKATETAKELLKPEARTTDGEAHHERTEADRMRREIAERLERLSETWLKQSKPE